MSIQTICALALVAVVGGGIAGVGAQPATPPTPPVPPTPPTAPQPPTTPETRERDRRVVRLDGRGSRLGVTVDDAAPRESGSDPRVVIAEVEPESPAARAGVQTGDRVAEYDGERVRSARQFSRLVQETPDGQRVPLVVLRGGDRRTLEITPEARVASWDFGIDGDRLRADIERGLRDLPELPRFEFDGPAFDFRNLPVPSSRRQLGVQLESLTPQLAEFFGVADGGVLISAVTDGSAAERAGLRAGDVITRVDGSPVRDAQALSSRLREAQAGQVSLAVTRDKRELTITATLESSDRNRGRVSSRSRRQA